MTNLHRLSFPLITVALLSTALPSHADFKPLNASSNASNSTQAILLNALQGSVTLTQPQPIRLLIISGPAEGCIAEGSAVLNPIRLRYEFTLQPINCVKNGQQILVGQVVRGQHNIKGTMANAGMGRSYLISNKGVTVTLTFQ